MKANVQGLKIELNMEETEMLHSVIQFYINSHFTDGRLNFNDVKFCMELRTIMRNNDIPIWELK